MIKPFNFQPEQTLVINESTNYTVPVGKYAKVCLINYSGQVLLNGVICSRFYPNKDSAGSGLVAHSHDYSTLSITGGSVFETSNILTASNCLGRLYVWGACKGKRGNPANYSLRQYRSTTLIQSIEKTFTTSSTLEDVYIDGIFNDVRFGDTFRIRSDSSNNVITGAGGFATVMTTKDAANGAENATSFFLKQGDVISRQNNISFYSGIVSVFGGYQ